jgi:hypothetical protein
MAEGFTVGVEVDVSAGIPVAVVCIEGVEMSILSSVG